MSARIEQLYYSWVPRGLEGINRFQVAAVSPGLASGQLARHTPLMRKLCRYDPPRRPVGELPVSFGWLTEGNVRIAFRRAPLPPERGKRGNFAAHVIAGPVGALPPALIARSFRSAFWWSGPSSDDGPWGSDEEMLRLAPLGSFEVALDDCGETEARQRASLLAPLQRRDHVAALAHAVLTLPEGDILAVSSEGAAFGTAIGGLTAVLPDALDGFNVSTWEGAATYPFDIVGTGEPRPGRRHLTLEDPDWPSDQDKRAAEILVGLDADGRLLRSAVLPQRAHPASPSKSLRRPWSQRELRAMRDATQFSPRQRTWDSALALVSASKGANLDDAALLATLRNPQAIAFLSRSPAGCIHISKALHNGDPDFLVAFRSAAESLQQAGGSTLDDALVESYASAQDLRGCAAAAGAISRANLRDKLLTTALHRACADATLAVTLDADDAVELIRRSVSAPSIVGPLLEGASRHVAACALHSEIPDAYVRDMVLFELARPAPSRALASALDARSGLLKGVEFNTEQTAGVVRLFAALPSEWQRVVIRNALAAFRDPQSIAQLGAGVEPMSATEAAEALHAGLAAIPAEQREHFGALSRTAAARLLAAPEILRGAREQLESARRLLEQGGPGENEVAVRLVAAMLAGERFEIQQFLEATTGLDEPLRSSLQDVVIEYSVSSVGSPEQVQPIWDCLARGQRPADTLVALLSYANAQHNVGAIAASLVWVAVWLLRDQPGLVGRRGELREGEKLAQSLVRRLDPARLRALDGLVEENAERRGKAWWRATRTTVSTQRTTL